MPENASRGSIETTPAELARIVQILSGRSGGKKPVFGVIGFSVGFPNGNADAPVFGADYRGRMDTAALRAEWYGTKADAGTSFQAATDQPDRLLDYISGGLFDPEKNFRLTYEGDSKRIVLSDGSRRASMATSAFSEVPRFEKSDSYGPAPGGLWVTSDPTKRPAPDVSATGWEPWVEKGYTVVKVKLSSIASLLSAGALLFSRYDKTLFRFDVHPEGIDVLIADPKNPDADTIQFGRVEGAFPQRGIGSETFSALFASVEPIFSSLRLVRAESLVLVHHPKEKRVNLLIAEDDAQGAPILRMTESFMSWRDPRDKTKGE